MTRRPPLGSGNLPGQAILLLLLEDSNPNLQPEDHVIGGLHRESEPGGHRQFLLVVYNNDLSNHLNAVTSYGSTRANFD
jgi:hypothetical protein